LEVKISINQIKNLMESITNRLDQTEERTQDKVENKNEDKIEALLHSHNSKEKNQTNHGHNFTNSGIWSRHQA
jgi:hypothetical protein